MVTGSSAACLGSFLGPLLLHTLAACFQRRVRSVSMDHYSCPWDCSQDMSEGLSPPMSGEDGGYRQGDRGEDMRNSARAAACVPALTTTIPEVMSHLGPRWGQGRGGSQWFPRLGQRGLGRGLGKPCLCPASASACPHHEVHGATAEREKGYDQVATIVHLNTYSSSCVRSAGTVASAALQFCFPPLPSPRLRGWSPHPTTRSPLARTVIHPVPSSPGGPCTPGDRKG